MGDSSVGKTHILHQLVNGCVPEKSHATLGVDFMMKVVNVQPQGESIRISFFDTSGEEKYHAITACHYRKATGALIVYDVTNR